MNDFHYREGELYCEDVPLSRIAKEVGTPCYVYSHHTLVRHFRVYDRAFGNIPHIVAFAMKANSNLAVLRLMAKEGSGVDIVSGGNFSCPQGRSACFENRIRGCGEETRRNT